jgi:hypothetical protein
MNAGYSLIAHTGHGSETALQMGGDKYLSDADFYNLTNSPRFSLMTTTGCYTTNFPYLLGDSLGEKFSFAPKGGGAFIGNSHYGWYYLGIPQWGLSAQYVRALFEVLFNGHANPVGDTHAFSRDCLAETARYDSYWLYVHYELNLMGDPAMWLWTVTPRSAALSHPASANAGHVDLQVRVTLGGEPVATALVTAVKDGACLAKAYTGGNGYATLSMEAPTEGVIGVMASREDMLPCAGEVVVTGTSTSPPNGWINPGWNWISFPLVPIDPDPASMFGYAKVENKLYWWHPVKKEIKLYPNDFTTVETGKGYTLLASEVLNPSYLGSPVKGTVEIDIPEQGWIWFGHPKDVALPLSSCSVRDNGSGIVRSATADAANADPWLNWNILYWDSGADEARLLLPGGGGDDTMLRPWHGYRLWAMKRNLTLLVPDP